MHGPRHSPAKSLPLFAGSGQTETFTATSQRKQDPCKKGK